MKVVLVHDWLTGMRGGEKVLERLALLYPDAPIFTLVWKRGAVSRAIESHPITTSFLQNLPDANRRYRWFLPLFPRAIESLRLPACDVVISTSHAAAKSVIAPPGAFHLSYLHTPIRYIWELEHEYFPPGRFPWPLSAYVRATCARLRSWDVATASRPDAMLANSRHVAARIRRHYGRDAEVVHPPVDVERFVPHAGERTYDLLAGAMAPYKNGELAIAACARLGRRLIVVGSGQEEKKLRQLAGPDVEFRGWVSDDELARLYAGARTLIFPGEEDFGIIPVEAMASGCPVIALARGGALETVGRGAPADAIARATGGGTARVPGGVLFGAPTVEALVDALREADAAPFDPARLAEVARPFAAPRFDAEFENALVRHRAEWRSRRSALSVATA